jgi:hypothetical protein
MKRGYLCNVTFPAHPGHGDGGARRFSSCIHVTEASPASGKLIFDSTYVGMLTGALGAPEYGVGRSDRPIKNVSKNWARRLSSTHPNTSLA